MHIVNYQGFRQVSVRCGYKVVLRLGRRCVMLYIARILGANLRQTVAIGEVKAYRIALHSILRVSCCFFYLIFSTVENNLKTSVKKYSTGSMRLCKNYANISKWFLPVITL